MFGSSNILVVYLKKKYNSSNIFVIEYAHKHQEVKMKWLVEVWGYVKLYIGWKITSKHSGIFCYIPAFDSSIYVFIPGYEGDLWFHVPRGRAGAISSQIPTQHWLPRRPQQVGGKRDQYSGGITKTCHGRGPGILQGLTTNAILFLFDCKRKFLISLIWEIVNFPALNTPSYLSFLRAPSLFLSGTLEGRPSCALSLA